MRKLILFAYILCSAILCGQNVNLSNGVVFDGEPYLAINPVNSQHIVVAWMSWINVANQFRIKTKTSFDGGQTWSIAAKLPHTIAGYSSADPCLDFNNNGDVFITYIDFTGTTPPVTGGVYICKSTDGGVTWGNPKPVITTAYDGTKWPIDRPWMVIDKSNSSNEGNIYVTTFNLNRLNPAYNPYLSISTDGGNTFSSRIIDTTTWRAGSINPFPICSPTVSSSGIFYGAYPSYVLTQSVFIQAFLVSSGNAGTRLSHHHIITFPQNSFPADTLAKKAALLLSNPANSDHLAYIYLSRIYGDLDVFFIESFNKGMSWSAPVRMNDDPVSNNRMQDLLWGDFDTDGDLVISWRDRRNGSDSTYQTESEIWATFRDKDSVRFGPNFQITSQTVAYDSVLENAGNDFMSIKLQDDILNAAWGDTRNGKLNIWYQRMNTRGTVLSIHRISSEPVPQIIFYPNPTRSVLHISGGFMKRIEIYDMTGKKIWQENYLMGQNEVKIRLNNLKSGSYIVKVKTNNGEYSNNIIKQ